jgi:hypothetical protein
MLVQTWPSTAFPRERCAEKSPVLRQGGGDAGGSQRGVVGYCA